MREVPQYKQSLRPAHIKMAHVCFSASVPDFYGPRVFVSDNVLVWSVIKCSVSVCV